MSWKRPNIGSRVNREVHARFWERAEVKFLRATRQSRRSNTSDESAGCPLHLQPRPNFGAVANRRGVRRKRTSRPIGDVSSALYARAREGAGGLGRITSFIGGYVLLLMAICTSPDCR